MDEFRGYCLWRSTDKSFKSKVVGESVYFAVWAMVDSKADVSKHKSISYNNLQKEIVGYNRVRITRIYMFYFSCNLEVLRILFKSSQWK